MISQPAPKLPRLREDLKLYKGPQHRDGSPTWRILDPARNRFFEIGWLEFELLARWQDYPSPLDLIAAVARDTPLEATEEELAGFVSFLVSSQLVIPVGEDREKLKSRWVAAKRPWYEQLFHNYLFFRIPVTKPDKFLDRTLPLVEMFYSKTFAAFVLTIFIIDLYLLGRNFGEVARGFQDLLSFQGGLYFAIAATFSKVIHELAHAYTAKRYGVRVPTVGVAFLVMWPMLYTDTGETWKLADHRKQLSIASAGIVSELVLACFATLLWAITPEGTLKYMFFVLATTTWVMTLAINASPFMRFDGYFLLSDALDFPNLHERSGACARWWIRKHFFSLEEAMPEPTFTGRQRFGLVVFALVTWVYRLIVFLGIALLVYHAFYKPLGILLWILEIGYFIIRPVSGELVYLWKHKQNVRPALLPFGALSAVLMLLIWMIPVSSEVTAPAMMISSRDQAVYAPFPAQVTTIHVKPGELVKEGQILVSLTSLEIDNRAQKAEVAVATARLEYLHGVATMKQQERYQVLREQYNEAAAEFKAVQEERARLELRAAAAGAVRDMPGDMVVGRWINPRDLIMRVVDEETSVIEAYLSDSQIGAVEVGQPVRFIPEASGLAVVKGHVRGIDTTGRKQVPPLLASTFGGDIPTVSEHRGPPTARYATYRIVIQPDEPISAAFAAAGNVRIATDLVLVTQNFLWRMLSIIVRESGI